MSPRTARISATLALAAVVSVGCSSQKAQNAGAADSGSNAGGQVGNAVALGGSAGSAVAPPASPIERVQRSAVAGSRVTPAELTVPGVPLFTVADDKPSPEDEGLLPSLAGVRDDSVLEGRELVRAVIAAKPAPRVIAQVALAVAKDDSQILDAPAGRDQRKLKIRPPAVAGSSLAFWVRTSDVPPQIERGTLDLTSGALTLQPVPQPPTLVIAHAMTTLDSGAVARHGNAIRTLAAMCTDSRARQALLSALGNHPRSKTRAAVADEVHRCGAPAVDPLVQAMEHDRAGLVRRQAAAALGRIGDARARPALAKAARGEDANLAWSAGNALKKLR